MNSHFRRDGTPYPEGEEGLLEWCRDFRDPSKKIIKQECVGRYWVSTVWLGFDYSFSDRPQIFESMVFDRQFGKGNPRTFNLWGWEINSVGKPLRQVKYSSLDDALWGHAELVREFKKRRSDDRTGPHKNAGNGSEDQGTG